MNHGLAIRDFTFGYDELLLFRNLNYTFNNGIYVFEGESGVGKTNLMRCIAGLNTGYQGKILLDDRLIRQPCADIFMMSQGYECFPWLHVLDQVLITLKARHVRITKEKKQKAEALLESLGLKDHLHKRPYEISGGQRQRVCIASALISEAPVMMFDEPTSALDDDNDMLVVDQMAKICTQLANICIIITHEQHVAKGLNGQVLRFTPEFRLSGGMGLS